MTSPEEFEEKLRISRKYKDILGIIENAECPICHNKTLKYNQHLSGSLDFAGSWNSQIKCEHCDLFRSDYKVTGYELYHMNLCEAGELQMLEGCYYKIEKYINH